MSTQPVGVEDDATEGPIARSGSGTALLVDDGTALDILVTDHLMPGMSGEELAPFRNAELADRLAAVHPSGTPTPAAVM